MQNQEAMEDSVSESTLVLTDADFIQISDHVADKPIEHYFFEELPPTNQTDDLDSLIMRRSDLPWFGQGTPPLYDVDAPAPFLDLEEGSSSTGNIGLIVGFTMLILSAAVIVPWEDGAVTKIVQYVMDAVR